MRFTQLLLFTFGTYQVLAASTPNYSASLFARAQGEKCTDLTCDPGDVGDTYCKDSTVAHNGCGSCSNVTRKCTGQLALPKKGDNAKDTTHVNGNGATSNGNGVHASNGNGVTSHGSGGQGSAKKGGQVKPSPAKGGQVKPSPAKGGQVKPSPAKASKPKGKGNSR